jgi:hypothetical protein
VTPSRPAGVRATAWARVLEAGAVGTIPGWTIPSTDDAGAATTSPARTPAQGRQHTAPIAPAVSVTCRGGNRRSTGSCATTPTAWVTAATRQRTTPTRSVPPSRPARPVSSTPARATTRPATSQGGNPSPSHTPARTAMRTGPVSTGIAVVPASRCSSAASRATSWTANRPTPQTTSSPRSRRVGATQPRGSDSSASPAVPTSGRPSAGAPGERSSPTARVPMNAEAHGRTGTTTAAASTAAGGVRGTSGPQVAGTTAGWRFPDVAAGVR